MFIFFFSATTRLYCPAQSHWLKLLNSLSLISASESQMTSCLPFCPFLPMMIAAQECHFQYFFSVQAFPIHFSLRVLENPAWWSLSPSLTLSHSRKVVS